MYEIIAYVGFFLLIRIAIILFTEFGETDDDDFDDYD